MVKKTGIAALCLITIMSLLPINTPAEISGTAIDAFISEHRSTDVPDTAADDSEELLKEYITVSLSEETGISAGQTFTGKTGAKLTGNDAVAYSKLQKEIEKAAAGELSSTEISISLDDLGFAGKSWTAEELGVSSLITGEKINSAACAALEALTEIHSGKVMRCLIADYPFDLYWYDKTAGFQYAVSYSFIVSGYGDDLTISFAPGWEAVISLSVAAEYAAETPYTIRSDLGTVLTKVRDTIDSILTAYAAADDYQKLLGYKNSICDLVSYNDQAASREDTAYGNPWQLLWVFDQDPETNVVCEGYSKAFQYLCDLTEFSNASVSCRTVDGIMTGGTGAGAHMWNIVSMEDGRNYLADITNCDEGAIGYPDGLFLAAISSGTVQGGYHFQTGSQELSYQYDDTMFDLYDPEELTVSAETYQPDNLSGPKDPTEPEEPATEPTEPEEPATEPAGPEETTDISGAEILLTKTAFDYTGKAITPLKQVVCDGKTLTPNKDYEFLYEHNLYAGEAKITVIGKNHYTGSVSRSFRILQAANPMQVSGKPVTIKYAKVKKKAQTLAAKKIFTVSRAQGKVTYKKTSGNAKITVSSAGKVTVKKGLRKGKYKIKVKITAAGNSNYKKLTKSVTAAIVVK